VIQQLDSYIGLILTYIHKLL